MLLPLTLNIWTGEVAPVVYADVVDTFFPRTAETDSVLCSATSEDATFQRTESSDTHLRSVVASDVEYPVRNTDDTYLPRRGR